MFERPWHVYRVLLPVSVALWFIAGVGADRTSSDGGLYYVAVSGWVGFCVAFVAMVAYGIGALIHQVRAVHHQHAS